MTFHYMKWLLMLLTIICANTTRAVVLWSDLGTTLVHNTGEGYDILGGAVKEDDSSTNTLYFKFRVDPLSDASTEEYFAAFELYEGDKERLGVGNALKAWAYSAFRADATGESQEGSDYIDLHSSRPEPSTPGISIIYENPHRGIECTIVFKVQYVPGGDDLVTVWLNPDLGPRRDRGGATGKFDYTDLRPMPPLMKSICVTEAAVMAGFSVTWPLPLRLTISSL